jgi:E3 ubiquitin-protein ligase CBL
MSQTVATNFRRRIDLAINSNRSTMRIDRRCIEKIWKQMDRIVKYCEMPKMKLINSPPYILDILPELYELLRTIITNYEDRLHILNEIEYIRIFIDNLSEQCTKIIESFKRAGHHMYDEQSIYRKYLIKYSLLFSHSLAELKSLFINGIYQGEKFRLTKQEAADFWKMNFNER